MDNVNERKPIRSARSVGMFLKRGMCSEAMFAIINNAYGHPLLEEEKASQPLVGGILQHGYQCGMVWGAAFGAGAEAFRRFGSGSEAVGRTIYASQRATDAFRELHDTIDCYDITGMSTDTSAWEMAKYFFLKGGTVRCFSKIAGSARVAFPEIERALSDPAFDCSTPCKSCASVVAKRLGLSDQHATMAAGLAGGIGLSGGACGALGAAIWAIELKRVQGGGKVNFQSSEARALIERFIKASDFEFLCEKIVGRRFGSIDDHTQWMDESGCAAIIDALTSAPEGSS